MAKHRYWRINVTAVQDAGGVVEMGEIELRVVTGGRDGADPISLISHSSRWNSTLDSTKSFDNDTTLRGWGSLSTGSMPQWIKLDCGVGEGIDPVQLAITVPPLAAGAVLTSYPKDFTVDYSDDDSAWTTALTVTGTGAWSNDEVRTFSGFSTGSSTEQYVGVVLAHSVVGYRDDTQTVAAAFANAVVGYIDNTQTVNAINAYAVVEQSPTSARPSVFVAM